MRSIAITADSAASEGVWTCTNTSQTAFALSYHTKEIYSACWQRVSSCFHSKQSAEGRGWILFCTENGASQRNCHKRLTIWCNQGSGSTNKLYKTEIASDCPHVASFPGFTLTAVRVASVCIGQYSRFSMHFLVTIEEMFLRAVLKAFGDCLE